MRASGKMKEQQHTDDNCGGSTDKSQDEQNLRSGSGVCERQAARNHQHGPHQSVMPVHRHRVAPYPARKPCVADRQRARKRSDAAICHPWLTCTQGRCRGPEQPEGISIRPHAGWTGTPSCFSGYAQCAAETRTPGGSAAGNPAAGFSCSRHGQPSVRRKRQCDENNRNEHLAGVRLSSSLCGSRPTLLPGINARPSRLALPGPPWPHHHSSPGPKMRPKSGSDKGTCADHIGDTAPDNVSPQA